MSFLALRKIRLFSVLAGLMLTSGLIGSSPVLAASTVVRMSQPTEALSFLLSGV